MTTIKCINVLTQRMLMSQDVLKILTLHNSAYMQVQAKEMLMSTNLLMKKMLMKYVRQTPKILYVLQLHLEVWVQA